MGETTLSLDEVEAIASAALIAAGATCEAAKAVARSTRLAERDGIRSHGLLYVPIYCEHLRCGKVDGKAAPVVAQVKPGSVRLMLQTALPILELTRVGTLSALLRVSAEWPL